MGELTPSKEALVGAFVEGLPFNQPVHVARSESDAGGRGSKGKASLIMRLPKVEGNASTRGRSANYGAAASWRAVGNHLAGGRAHRATLMTYDARADPKVYREINIINRSEMSVDHAVSMVNQTSGALGEAFCRHLKSQMTNTRMPSRSKIRARARESWHPMETGKLVMDDPKRPGKVKVCGYMVVTSVHYSIQRTVNRQEDVGISEWPPNVPPWEIWMMATIDKGGDSTKLIVKFNCCSAADSPHRTLLIGLMDDCSDKYQYVSIAFEKPLAEISTIRRIGHCVRSGWRQRLPTGFVRGEAGEPKRDTRSQKEIEAVRRSAAKGGAIKWKPPPLPPRASTPLPLLLPPAKVETPSPVAFTCSLKTSPPPMATEHGPWPPASSRAEDPSGHTPQQLLPALDLAICQPAEEAPDRDLPPLECRPDCTGCASFAAEKGGSGRRKHGPRPTGCPTALREARASNGTGPVQPILEHHLQEAPRQRGCTWSSTCSVCAMQEDGQLRALEHQWAASEGWRAPANRRIRMFLGSDWMETAEVLGIGPPSSKQFCFCCLAILHETNASGVAHLREQPQGHEETRSKRAADPPARAGSASISLQQSRLVHERELHACGEVTRKPEAADFDSCLHEPLVWVDGPPERSVSTMALHLLLGLAKYGFDCLFGELQEYDVIFKAQRSETLTDAKAQAKLQVAQAQVDSLKAESQSHESRITSLREQMDSIENGPNGELVRERMGRRRLKEWGSRGVEEEKHKQLADELKVVNTALKAASAAATKAEAAVVALYKAEAGPFVRSFYQAMDRHNLERQAHHSGALTGKDGKKLLTPEVTDHFARLLNPQLAAELTVETSPDGSPSVRLDLKNAKGIGSAERAEKYTRFWLALGEASSIWTRFEPLCDHEIARFKCLAVEIAQGFVDLWPDSEPPPKLHMLLYHVITQMEWLGSSGQLHEGVVEAFHVLDNRLKIRFTHVKNAEAHVRARAQALFQLTDVTLHNIRRMDQERERSDRLKRNRTERIECADDARRRRLLREEDEAML